MIDNLENKLDRLKEKRQSISKEIKRLNNALIQRRWKEKHKKSS